MLYYRPQDSVLSRCLMHNWSDTGSGNDPGLLESAPNYALTSEPCLPPVRAGTTLQISVPDFTGP